MKELSLKNILLNHINATQGWISKGQLHLFAEQEGYSPEGAGRELRHLAEEGTIQVSYYKGKRNQTLSRYAKLGESKPLPIKPIISFIERNGQRIAKITEPLSRTFIKKEVTNFRNTGGESDYWEHGDR